jgi:hypothetical protein
MVDSRVPALFEGLAGKARNEVGFIQFLSTLPSSPLWTKVG